MVNGEKVDQFVSKEFLAGVVYGGQVVVTNPTSSTTETRRPRSDPEGRPPGPRSPRHLHPHGSAWRPTPPSASSSSSTSRHRCSIHVYPAHLSKNGARSVAHAADPSSSGWSTSRPGVDETSWAHLSQWGSEEQVLAYLATGKPARRRSRPHRVALPRETPASSRRPSPSSTCAGIYHPVLYSYGIHHNTPPPSGSSCKMEGRNS